MVIDYEDVHTKLCKLHARMKPNHKYMFSDWTPGSGSCASIVQYTITDDNVDTWILFASSKSSKANWVDVMKASNRIWNMLNNEDGYVNV